ncbi:MAG: DUF456 family protein [Dehalococcoidia bacterium]|nr:DUF456 family protein [Dehalococcoidia bacterium]MBL7166423.1 DUF456 family protein [Dehalococcoidales bacterium]
MVTVLLAILCSVLLIAGLAGIVLPVLPGVPLAWLGFFVYAIGTGFDRISITTTVVFSILMVLTLVLDLVAPMLGASKYKASKLGILGSFVGLMAGIIVLGFWGIILGPFIGALLGELVARKQPEQAFKSALGTLLGFLAGSLIKIVVVLTMAGFFIASLL